MLERSNHMSKVRIAIIDSGVRLDHPAINGYSPQIIYHSGLKKGEGRCGHGTAIYNIIKKTEPFADIINFQITNKDEEINKETLLSCLSVIRDEYNVDIINISLGLSLCDDVAMLRKICDELISKGVIIVSAFDNIGAISYPAAFKNVIGVTSFESCRKINDFVVFDDDVINIGANGNVQRLAWDTPDYIFWGGNSFACAHVTVQVARFMAEGSVSFSEIINRFREMASKVYCNDIANSNKNVLFKINQAAIFPFNKEMHSLVRFQELLSFEISGVYDIRESSNVGATTNHVMKTNSKSFLIQNVEEMDWSSFDTIIIGNIPSRNAHVLAKARESIINKAIELHKNIFSFDDLRNKYDYDQLYCPTVDSDDVPAERLGKLYRICKPVVGIYGTSSCQGKFTLQLELRKKFLEYEYTVGQIGTEPSAQLFGMDYAYPMGYNSSVYIDGHDSIAYINECIQKLCDNNCDIIITGSQASVLPIDICNKSMFPMKQYSFLMGTQPDCIVLCVNPYDTYDYVQRTINFLESCVDSKVIAICVYPMQYKKNWTGMYSQKEPLQIDEFDLLKVSYNKDFSIPVYQLGNSDDIVSLFNDIVSFFSER